MTGVWMAQGGDGDTFIPFATKEAARKFCATADGDWVLFFARFGQPL